MRIGSRDRGPRVFSQRSHLVGGGLWVPLPISPLLVDHCWRCGRVFSGSSYARQLAGHEAHCKIPGAPPAHIWCRNNCGRSFPWKFTDTPGKHNHHAREARNLHEKICRGSDELTRECPYSFKLLPEGASDDLIFQHRASCDSRPQNEPSLYSSWQWRCPSCNARIPSEKQVQRAAMCRGSAQANRTCVSCKAFFQTADARIKHESLCRGSEQANLTCCKCGRLFSSWGSRITREKSCGR